MKVTCDTKGVQIMNKGNKLANASITLDDAFVIRNLSVMNSVKGIFVSMPSQKGLDKDGREAYFDTAFPLNGDLRKEINKVVLDAYSEKLNELAQQATQNRSSDMSADGYVGSNDAPYGEPPPEEYEYGGF